jgi:hypothetical protein
MPLLLITAVALREMALLGKNHFYDKQNAYVRIKFHLNIHHVPSTQTVNITYTTYLQIKHEECKHITYYNKV